MPHASARFSEQLESEWSFERKPRKVGIVAAFFLMGLAIAVLMEPLPVRAVGLVFAAIPAAIYYLAQKPLRVEVRDDGVHYWNGLVFRHGQIPANEIIELTWEEGNAFDSDIFTREEYDAFTDRRDEEVMDNARESGSWFTPQRPSMAVVNHGAKAIKHGASSQHPEDGGARNQPPWDVDLDTEAVVRIDDADGSIYLFATDHPEEFIAAVEEIRDDAASQTTQDDDAQTMEASA
jgi:hypothetical protein